MPFKQTRLPGRIVPTTIYEDEDILVVDKPVWLVVDRSDTNREKTLQDWVENKGSLSLPKSSDRIDATDFRFGREFISRSGIVHRLDKETSGLLIVAKNSESFCRLQDQFKHRLVKKKYLALVHGLVYPKSGEITAPISRSAFNRKKFGVFIGGRESKTVFNSLKNFKIDGRDLTLLELSPATGRTHQLRVHLKHLGHPIVADIKYGGRKTSRKDRQWCPRQFLHASEICFTHPSSGDELSFNSPLPEDLKKVLNFLGKHLYSSDVSH